MWECVAVAGAGVAAGAAGCAAWMAVCCAMMTGRSSSCCKQAALGWCASCRRSASRVFAGAVRCERRWTVCLCARTTACAHPLAAGACWRGWSAEDARRESGVPRQDTRLRARAAPRLRLQCLASLGACAAAFMIPVPVLPSHCRLACRPGGCCCLCVRMSCSRFRMGRSLARACHAAWLA